MDYVKLNNGVEMPILGLGVFLMKDLAECEQVVMDAISAGYRLIDTAKNYGNETAVGSAIQKCGVPRDELFITTKLWLTDATYERAKVAFETSLEKLQLDYLDLYLIHQPVGDVYGAWRAMEELYAAGRIRAIGVSNFYADRLVDFALHNEVAPALDQVEFHPFHQRTELRPSAAEFGVQLESWGPLAQGKHDIFTNPVLTGIAETHHKTIAQVTLRWAVQHGVVVIPKSVRRERLVENLDVFDFELTPAEMAQIDDLDTGKPLGRNHQDPESVKFLSSL